MPSVVFHDFNIRIIEKLQNGLRRLGSSQLTVPREVVENFDKHQFARYDGTVTKLVRYLLNSFAKRVRCMDQRHPVPRVSENMTQSQSTFG